MLAKMIDEYSPSAAVNEAADIAGYVVHEERVFSRQAYGCEDPVHRRGGGLSLEVAEAHVEDALELVSDPAFLQYPVGVLHRRVREHELGQFQ